MNKCQIAFFTGVPPNLGGIKYFDLLGFTTIIHSPNPKFVPSLSEMSCITYCLVQPGFLVDTRK